MKKSINLVKDLKFYDAHLLAYPDIGNTIIERDEFKADTGITFYSKERLAYAPVSFSIEFKGSKSTIRKNRNKVSKLLDMATITFDEEVFYKGRFLGESGETRYWYQVVTYKGNAIAMLDTQRIEIPIGKQVTIYNNGNLLTPCRFYFEGSSKNVKIKGFDDLIDLYNVDDTTRIDAEEGLYQANIEYQYYTFSFPYLDDKVDLLVEADGNIKCFMEFEGRVIC
ncbi:hypothetical protein [uncultured Anaerococcus sp.]|uniref:hypothetical protein n=1 Tax=uncultured Anaerococcus sp. TaxID=293428 RepID=UPI00288C5234|nr:hypothetical protein [uncultured Anaerococcus sp.]